MGNVYKREGDSPETGWNSLVRQINELVPECDGVSPLDEVSEKHRWSKKDIRDAQDKLTELCDENTFTSPPEKWEQSTIDELKAAIENGTCCCEEEDRTFPGMNIPHRIDGGDLTHAVQGPSFNYLIRDWANWIAKEQVPPFQEEIPQPIGPPQLLEAGGPRWVGREFKKWEVFIQKLSDPLTTPVKTGHVIDGYIFIGTEEKAQIHRAYETALIEFRQATTAVSAAQLAVSQATDPESLAAAQEALAEAQEELDAKEAAKDAAEAAAEANPATENYPWRVQFHSTVGGINQWLFLGDGPDGYVSDPISNTQLRQHNTFILPIDEVPDSPHVKNFGAPSQDPGDGVLRLSCEAPE